jgi:hypothetical protein
LTVLNKVGDRDTEQIMRAKLAEWGIRPSGIIPQKPDISLAWLNGSKLSVDTAGDAMTGVVDELERQARNHLSMASGA